MLQNQNPVRRWKQWLVLPVLVGLVPLAGRTAHAQPTPSAPIKLSFIRGAHKDISGKVHEAMHLDSLRTGGKFEPGTKQDVSVAYTSEEPIVITLTVTRVPITPPVPQPVTSSGHKVYTFVEEMPHLSSGGGQRAVVEAILHEFIYPKLEPAARLEGRVFVGFTVDIDGSVHDAKIVKGLAPVYDEAVLAAVRKLPAFVPGKQNGNPVAVSFTLPVSFYRQ